MTWEILKFNSETLLHVIGVLQLLAFSSLMYMILSKFKVLNTKCFITMQMHVHLCMHSIIGVAQGGAKGAEAPPTPILEGAKPLHF